jgi:hypothetical protein
LALPVWYLVSKLVASATARHLRIARITHWLYGTREMVKIFRRSWNPATLISFTIENISALHGTTSDPFAGVAGIAGVFSPSLVNTMQYIFSLIRFREEKYK